MSDERINATPTPEEIEAEMWAKQGLVEPESVKLHRRMLADIKVNKDAIDKQSLDWIESEDGKAAIYMTNCS